MNTVINIRPFHGRKGLYLITLDDGTNIKAPYEVIYKFKLKPGMDIDCDKISGFIYETDLNLAYNMSLKFLGYRIRSCKEIKNYLSSKGFSDDVTEAVIEKLHHYSFLDDEKFSIDYVNSKMNLKPVSRRYIEYKLKEKGISSHIIESVVNKITDEDETDNAIKVCQKYIKKYRNLEKKDARLKIEQALIRKGFEWGIVNTVMNRFFND